MVLLSPECHAAGLFAWYPFKKEAELLEIDAEYGALTGLFCDKCKKVAVTETCYERAKAIAKRYNDRENLTVYAGALEDFDYTKFCDRFDYIVINGVLERKGYGYKEQKAYLEYLNLIQKMLKPTGILLLVVNNRYGLQYFCGKREKFTGYPYEGINQYPDGTPAYGFEKGKCQACWKIVDLHIKSSIIRFQMQIIRRLLQQMRAGTGMILKSVLHFMTEIQIHLLPEKSA